MVNGGIYGYWYGTPFIQDKGTDKNEKGWKLNPPVSLEEVESYL